MIAIYRVLYGEEYIAASIESISPHVDDVYVFLAAKPFGDVEGVEYKGKWVSFPKTFDGVAEEAREAGAKVKWMPPTVSYSPHNQFSRLSALVDLDKHDTVLAIEPDQVFEKWPTHPKGATPQRELWKTDYEIPQRNRPGPIFLEKPIRKTMANGWPVGLGVFWNDGVVTNYGFCVSDKTMYWKHLLAMAYSPVIRDSIPNPDWYEDKWLNWTPETENLEISLGKEDRIPYAR